MVVQDKCHIWLKMDRLGLYMIDVYILIEAICVDVIVDLQFVISQAWLIFNLLQKQSLFCPCIAIA